MILVHAALTRVKPNHCFKPSPGSHSMPYFAPRNVSGFGRQSIRAPCVSLEFDRLIVVADHFDRPTRGGNRGGVGHPNPTRLTVL